MNYRPLNIKSNYHILSSLVDISTLVEKAKEYGMDALAITDPTMFYVMDFYKACKANHIKPIIGLTVTIESHSVLLYAMNYEGYQNLTRVLYHVQKEDLNLELLKTYSSNIICILPFQSIEYYEKIRSIYPNLYLGYQSLEEREKVTKTLEKLVYIEEVLYLEKNEYEYLKYLYLIRDNKKRDEIENYQVKRTSYLMNKDDALKQMDLKDIKNMDEIVRLCNVEFPTNQRLLPKYKEEMDFNARDYLAALCMKGLNKRFQNTIKPVYIERLKYELSIIDKMEFNNYFLVVFDFIQYAKKNGILVGPGRGSAAGSLVSYALGITDVDPLQYNLLFERFLNPERITMPDIDIDFESTRRGEVVEYVIKKYGEHRVAPIITFVTLGSKQVIRDLGRIFDVEGKYIDLLAKQIDSALNLKENRKNPNVDKLLNHHKILQDVYQIGMRLEGSKRQLSTHAAGVIISSEELYKYIPLQKYDDYFITGYSMEHLEELGLLKIDFLGLQNLTLIDHVLHKIKETDPNFEWNQIPLNDKKTLDLFASGKTVGIFQFESAGMKSFLKKLKPDTFEDIVAANALFRPGPMQNIDEFIRRKQGKGKEDYIIPNLKDILKPTYGIIVYQEQIMQIANVLAGYSLGEADILRRAMSKKKREVLEQEKSKFVSRGIERGYLEKDATKVFDFILEFANYGFNRSHSVAYSLIGYRMAYLKAYYPNIFMSNLLSNVIGNDSKIKEYMDDAKSLGIEMLKPNINKSGTRFEEEGKNIRYSLSAIHQVGGIASNLIVKEREKGWYTDFFDFVGRTYGKAVTKKTIEAFIDAGCFDEFGYHHQTLHNQIEAAINYAEVIKTIDSNFVDKPYMEEFIEFDREELLKRELSALGLYLSNHPVINYKLNSSNLVLSTDMTNYFDKTIEMMLYVEKVRTIDTKTHEKMMFMTATDEAGEVQLVLFPNTLKRVETVQKGDIIAATGRVEKRMSSYQLNVVSVKSFRDF